MPVKFIAIPRKDPANPAAAPRYYPRTKSSGVIEVRQLMERIAEMSTLSSADIVIVLEALLQVIPQYIAEGKIVRLGALGSFRLSLQGEGVDTPETLSAKHIKSHRILFRPGREFRKALKTIQYRKAAK
ncbi:MAG: DNA-binding protein [Candidatus Brocadia sp. WS118]|nr:MAG: DNA-binding protein [Candidatus Brocadia sp. WS118]